MEIFQKHLDKLLRAIFKGTLEGISEFLDT
jgi:hypothetical protein